MSSRSRDTEPPKKEGYSSAAFWIVMIAVIVITIILIIMIILYFRGQGSLIDPANCPEPVSGVIVTPNTQISTPATNCGNNVNCTYIVGSIQEAVQICEDLGTLQCAAFSLEQVTNTDNYSLTISSLTDTTNVGNSDTFRIIT